MRHKLLFVLLLALATVPVSAKSLRWRALGVTANLDRDGLLHGWSSSNATSCCSTATGTAASGRSASVPGIAGAYWTLQ